MEIFSIISEIEIFVIYRHFNSILRKFLANSLNGYYPKNCTNLKCLDLNTDNSRYSLYKTETPKFIGFKL